MSERNVVEYLKDLLEETHGIRPLTRNENGDVICYQCGRVAKEHCYTEAGLREVEISGLCEECFDKMFEEDEEIEDETHKELLPNNVGTFEERDVPDGYHYELQLLNGIWQWVLVANEDKE